MIPITYLRSSSFNTHDFCPMKYFGEYVLGWTDKGNKKADKGTIVHVSMEILALVKQAAQNSETTLEHEITGPLSFSCPTFSDLDIEDVFVPVYNYYAEHTSYHNWTSKDMRECRIWLYKALEFNNGYFNPLLQKIIQPEQQFTMKLDKYDWAYYNYPEFNLEGYLELKGTIDLIVENENGNYECIDYKTGARKNWATGEEYDIDSLRHNFQLRLYHLVLHELYPNIENFLITIYYINDGGPFTLCFSDADLDRTLDIVREKYEEIKNTEVPELNKTWKCSKFCSQGANKGIISTFEDTNIKPMIQVEDGHLTSKGQICSKCEQISNTLKYRDIVSVIKNMTRTGFSSADYKAPGSIE